jgi:hypothetical protein
MQAQQPSQRLAYSYARFYEDCAIYPELPKFRRFGAQWAKKLYDDGEELMKREDDLNRAISRMWGASATPPTFLDYPRMLVTLKKNDNTLYDQWLEYEQRLRTYCRFLHLVLHLA